MENIPAGYWLILCSCLLTVRYAHQHLAVDVFLMLIRSATPSREPVILIVTGTRSPNFGCLIPAASRQLQVCVAIMLLQVF